MDKAAKKKYVFGKTVYLSDTNAEGNVYFAKYFEWQGQAREEFVRQYVPTVLELLKAGIIMITCDAHCNYFRSAYLFDSIEIEIRIANPKQASFHLLFIISNKATGTILATGSQKIAFGDATGKLLPIPEEIKVHLGSFVEENPDSVIKGFNNYAK